MGPVRDLWRRMSADPHKPGPRQDALGAQHRSSWHASSSAPATAAPASYAAASQTSADRSPLQQVPSAVKTFDARRPSAARHEPRGDPIVVNWDRDAIPSSGRILIQETETFQTMEGLGGSLAYYKNWVSEHPNKEAIYDKMFTDLHISVLRLRNYFKQPDKWTTAEAHMDIDRRFVEAANARLKDNPPKIMLAAWSPPAELKQNESLFGADSAVLKKDNFGHFRYRDFAQFWLDSIVAYGKLGVDPTWISIQNEPDYITPNHETCKFDASESFAVPGYYRAFDVTYDLLSRSLQRMPQMIAPDTAGFDSFRNHPYGGSPRISAQAAHIYNAGTRFDAANFFTNLEKTLVNGVEEAKRTQTKKIFMTEYANLQPHQPRDPLLLARTIHDTFTKGNASMYLNWDLAWGKGVGEGTLLLVDSPFQSKDLWTTPMGFSTTQSYEWFKHFCRYIRPGMVRVGAHAGAAVSAILPLAFRGRDGSTTLIFINTETHPVLASLTGLPPEYPGRPYRCYYSTLSEKFTEVPKVSVSDPVELRPESITTVYSGPLD